jgi:hypothetical protein
MTTRPQRTKAEQDRRNKAAKLLLKLRRYKTEPKMLLDTGLFNCRSCWKIVPVEKLRFRVCPTCRAGKEEEYEKIIETLVKAGAERYKAEIEIAKRLF